MNNLKVLLDEIDKIELNLKYKDDITVINEIRINLDIIINSTLTENIVNEVEGDISYLVNKYVELDNLENLFDDIKFELKRQIHNANVAKLREKNRRKAI